MKSASDKLLETSGLTKRFGGLIATNDVALQVADGEVHALIGPNGAGKSSLIAQLSGLLRPDSGWVRFDGKDVTRAALDRRVRLGLARSYQITSIFRSFSVLDNIALAVQARTGSSFAFWKPVCLESDLFDEARMLLERVGLEQRARTPAGQLAHGEQRQLEVGLVLATNPKLLLLDEPMAGMGPDESARMIKLIGEIRQTATVLLVEHDMDAVFRLADRISVLVAGRVIATGTPDQIRADPQVKKAYLGDEITS